MDLLILDKDFNKKLLIKSEKLLAELPPDFKKYLVPKSWTNIARDNLIKIDKVNEIRKRSFISPILSTEQLNELSASVLELDDLCELLEWREKLSGPSKKAFEDNIRSILKMPLTIDKETCDEKNKNQGRDKLFESSLFIKFKKAGYSVQLGDNPDLLVEVNGRKYAIECKRICNKDSYKNSIKRANDGLKKHSLEKTSTLGIVAIDYSKYFIDRPIQIIARSESELRYLFDLRESGFVSKTRDIFKNTNFGPLIPFMFLNHRGMGYEIDLPYSFKHLNIQETDYNGVWPLNHNLLQDFDALLKSVNEK